VFVKNDSERAATNGIGGEKMGLTWQAILFGILLIIVGWAIASAPSSPVWLYPAMGLTFVAGGVVTFVAMLKD